MSEQSPLDLYNIIAELGDADWIDEIRIFGSRRYLSNSSYGSDIDLLIVPNRQVPIDKLREIVKEPYIDAFMLDGALAISAMNDTRINVGEAAHLVGLNAKPLWSRAKGWLTGEEYRTLDIIPDKNPTITRPNKGAIILFCALASEFGKKKSLASIAINFADTTKVTAASAFRWEASAGVFFSTLPIRSFSVAPVFTNGVITNKVIAQNVLHPTVVPFAAGNFRLTNDLKLSRWKSNLYWTGAVGVNPNTVSADFATGLSLSWRALMVSALAHFGHDTQLTQGLTVGQSLGASFNGNLPTQTHWTTSFAIGLSVRIPALTGR